MSVIYISQKSIKFALVISFIYNVIIKRGKGELPSFLCNLLFGNFTLFILFFCYVIVRLLYAVTFFLLELNLYYTNKNDIMLLGNKLKSILMAVVLLSLTSMAMAQKVTVQGTVTDQNGETVIGAAILEKGTSNGTVTDFDGKYTLKVEKGATLVFSYIGYITEEFVANSDQTFNLVMILILLKRLLLLVMVLKPKRRLPVLFPALNPNPLTRVLLQTLWVLSKVK